MDTPPPQPLPCCLEVPDAFAAKARHALTMLLYPLGLAPRWTPRADLRGAGLYYGPADAAPEGALALALDPGAPAYFAGRTPYPAADVHWRTWDGGRWPVLFGDGDRDDLVASAFFWLSGWQEWTTTARDRHGRFAYADSLQARWDLALRPAVDAYREQLAARLAAQGVPVRRRTWEGRAWACCPTVDVDYLRKWRPGIVWREAVHYLLLNHRRVGPGARLRRLARAVPDALRPGDPFRAALQRIPAELARRSGQGTFFFKAGAHGPHDVGYRLGGSFARRQVAALAAQGHEVGLHPSYYAHAHAGYLEAERDAVARVAGRPVTAVRQHYLRWEAPTTPRLHEAAGFRVDSTLGFAETLGFRHATTWPFRLYDLAADRPLDVWELPLAVMESALFNRRMLDAEAAVDATREVLAVVRRHGGAAVLLWHNTLWDELDYPGWGRHFEAALDAARAADALVAPLGRALAAVTA